MWGLLLSVLLWIFLPGHPLWVLVACGLGFGAVYGVLAQCVQHAMTHPSKVGATAAVATKFEVQAEADVVDHARRVIDKLPAIVHPSDSHVGLVEHLLSSNRDKSRKPAKAPEPSAPVHPRHAAPEDEAWLHGGATKPVPPEQAAHLADQTTQLIFLPPDSQLTTMLPPVGAMSGDAVLDTSENLRPITPTYPLVDTGNKLHPIAASYPYNPL